MKLLIRLILLSVAVFLADYLVAGVHTDGWLTIVIAGALLTVVQFIVKPIIRILTLPITIITLGIFLVVLNALFFWFVSGIVPGMDVDTFTAALFGSLVVSVFNWIGSMFGKNKED